MIVKVQNSITTTHGIRQILVYNKNRSIMQQFDADNDTLANLPLKSYWYAHVNKAGALVLDNEAPEQEW